MVLGRQGSRSCDYFHAKMRGGRRTAKSDRSKAALTPVDAPIGTFAHRAPQRRRAVARWTANGAVTDGDPPLVPFDENQACPSSTPNRKRMTVITNIYGRNQLVTNMSGT